ncbi:MAG: response regulator [Acidimicrobiia bacterium]
MLLQDNTTTNSPPVDEGGGLEVMLVEDDPLQRWLLAECVRRAGLAEVLKVFSDAESALAFLHESPGGSGPGRPDLVLLDRCLPGLSGEDLLRCIRADERICTLPVIVLSNSVEPVAITRAYAAGANCYIEKRGTVEATVAIMRQIRSFFGGVVILPPQSTMTPMVDQVANSGL